MEKRDHKFNGKEDRNYHQQPFGDVESPETPVAETARLRTEINEDDIRDQGDSTRDWDAEGSRTGRHK